VKDFCNDEPPGGSIIVDNGFIPGIHQILVEDSYLKIIACAYVGFHFAVRILYILYEDMFFLVFPFSTIIKHLRCFMEKMHAHISS